jgi:hypothetical protein
VRVLRVEASYEGLPVPAILVLLHKGLDVAHIALGYRGYTSPSSVNYDVPIDVDSFVVRAAKGGHIQGTVHVCLEGLDDADKASVGNLSISGPVMIGLIYKSNTYRRTSWERLLDDDP